MSKTPASPIPAQQTPERPRFNRQFFIEVWRLAKPYWISEERCSAWALLAVIVALNLFQVYLSVRNNIWFGDFYGAMQRYDRQGVIHQFWVFAVIAAAFVTASVVADYLQQMLQIRWRRWMTGQFTTSWLGGKTYYRLQVIDPGTDNPDQRIQEDVRDFPIRFLDLTLGLMNSVVSLFSFLGLLWVLSGTFTLPLGHWGTLPIPGYGVWAALIYSILGTWITIWIGRPLIGLDYQQQRYEADFRYSLVRLRENAESVAFFNGEKPELGAFRRRFASVVDNFHGLMRRRMRLGFFSFGFSQASVFVSFAIALPPYFAHKIDIGGYQQFGTAFQTVQGSLSYIVNAFTTIAMFQAIVMRLSGFSARLAEVHRQAAAETGFVFHRQSRGFGVDTLSLDLPDGKPLISAASFDLAPGDRTLLTGPSGAGKTTLLRALGHLWPFGRGTIRSGFERPLFLPQRPYLPIGSLRQVILYPHGDPAMSDARLEAALTAVGLPALGSELDREDNWADRLSLGEQQRLNFARILLQKPDGIFMDEATSALDETAETALYGLLGELPEQPTILSVGHRSSLRAHHNRELALSRSAAGGALTVVAE